VGADAQKLPEIGHELYVVPETAVRVGIATSAAQQPCSRRSVCADVLEQRVIDRQFHIFQTRWVIGVASLSRSQPNSVATVSWPRRSIGIRRPLHRSADLGFGHGSSRVQAVFPCQSPVHERVREKSFQNWSGCRANQKIPPARPVHFRWVHRDDHRPRYWPRCAPRRQDDDNDPQFSANTKPLHPPPDFVQQVLASHLKDVVMAGVLHRKFCDLRPVAAAARRADIAGDNLVLTAVHDQNRQEIFGILARLSKWWRTINDTGSHGKTRRAIPMMFVTGWQEPIQWPGGAPPDHCHRAPSDHPLQ